MQSKIIQVISLAILVILGFYCVFAIFRIASQIYSQKKIEEFQNSIETVFKKFIDSGENRENISAIIQKPIKDNLVKLIEEIREQLQHGFDNLSNVLEISINDNHKKIADEILNFFQDNSNFIYENMDTQSNISPDYNIADETYKYLTERYGMGNKSIEVQWIIGEDGSAIVRRYIELEAFSQVTTLETYLAIPENQEVENPRDISFGLVEAVSEIRKLNIKNIDGSSPSKLGLSLEIVPPLRKGDSLEYKLHEILEKSSYSVGLTSTQQRARKEQNDYCGWNINLPTRKLVLKVFLPETAKPKEHWAEVRYASPAGFPAKRLQLEETERFHDKPIISDREGKRLMLTLEVDHPVTGFIYLLYWKPRTID